MIALTLVVLTLLAVVCVVSWLPRLAARLDALPWWLVAGVPAAALAAAAILAAANEVEPNTFGLGVSSTLVVVIAVLGGGPVSTAILRGAERSGVPGVSRPTETIEPGDPLPPDREVLAGGLWIGALERAAIAACLLVGMAEGIALVLGLKGVGRYPELRETGAAERFIIGTFSSVLWASACAGVAILLR